MTTPPIPTPSPLPPPDPNNPRDLRNRPIFQRKKESRRREREQQQQRLTIAEPVTATGNTDDADGDHTMTVLAVQPSDGVHTDNRNAREFISLWQEDVRFCRCSGHWVEWTGNRWEPDLGAAGMQERGRDFSEYILAQAAECSYPKEGQELLDRGRALGNLKGVTALLKFAASDPRIFLRSTAVWDADPFLLGVENGVVDLRDMRFLPAQREMMITKSAAVTYDAAATCPKWEAFVQQILPDPQVRHFMQVSAGYWLTGDTGAQCFWFLYGSGSNGKTTFLETLYHLGGGYSQKAGGMLTEKPMDNNTLGELAELPGTRLLIGSEVSDGMRLAETLVKDITGGDTIRARFLYKPYFSFRPSCKLVMFGNHRPTISGTDGGMWRRVRLVPFTTVVPAEQQNEDLQKQLLTELPGILNWCLRGLADWHANKRKLPMPDAVKNATEGYREDSDVLGEFLNEHTERVLDIDERVLMNDLYKRYGAWCIESGRRHPLSRQTFHMRLEDRGYPMKDVSKGWAILGLRLRDPDPFDS